MVDFLIGQYRGALQTEDHDANDLDDVEVHSQIGAGNLESVHAHDRIGQPQPNAFRKSSHGTHCRNPPSGFQRSPNMGCSEERVLVPPTLSWVCSVRTI